jgi:phospholipid/cholesterol/gamma-HCH transport system substrate-binding protein
MGKVMEMVPKIQNMLPKLDSILASVNYILADPALPNTLHHAEQVTSDLTKTTRQMNALLADVGKEVPGLMGKADGVLGKAAATMDNANVATQKLAQLDLESSLNELTVTLNNLKQFTEQLNNDQGALGALLKDRSLYDNLNKTINSADSLLVNFKEHPKRYIHFSVFGKKDK